MKIKNYFMFKKIFVLIFVVGMCFSSFGAQRVGAFWGIGDIVNDPLHTVQGTITAGATVPTAVSTTATAVSTTAGTIVNTAHASWATLGKNTLDALAYQAAQIALNQLTDNTIAWIKGGFHGAPSFTIDTQAMGDELADSVTLGLVSRIKGLATCEFSAEYIDNLTDSYTLSKKKSMPITCPFPDSVTAMKIYGTDVEAAVNSFSWEIFSSALDDAGNPYGVQIVTANELQANQAKAKANSDQKMSWSNGYADIVDTNNCPGMPPESKEYIEKGTASEAVGGYADPKTGEWVTGEAIYDPPEQATVQALQKSYCKTTTPGNIVSDQLSSTLHLDMDRLGFADNLNKIISALLTVAVQSAIRSVF